MTATAASGVQCPKCGAANMWDNRVGKRNPKAPDFKCRDKACDGVIWPPKNGAAQSAPATPPANVKQPLSAGPYIPAIDDGSDALPTEKLNHLFNVYDVCMGHALVVAKRMDHEQIGSSPESTAAIAATLLIAAQRAGV